MYGVTSSSPWHPPVRTASPTLPRGRRRSVLQDAPDADPVAHVLVALVDVLQVVAPGDELVELELAGLVQVQQVRDVAARVGIAEDGPDQLLALHGQVQQVKLHALPRP